MLDILSLASSIKRPSLLVRTARFGVDDYRRTTHLARIFKSVTLPRSGQAILRLIEIEAEMENMRRVDRAEYSIANHVEVLIAIMGESRLLRAATRPVCVSQTTDRAVAVEPT